MEDLRALGDPAIDELIELKVASAWIGPGRHCVLYPLRDGQEYNMVLLRPDNMPLGVNRSRGDIDEMTESFKGWDRRQVLTSQTLYDDVLTRETLGLPNSFLWSLLF